MKSRAGHAPTLMFVVSIAALSIMDALIKHLTADFGALQISMMRYLVGSIVALPFAWTILRDGLSLQSIRANSLRGLVMIFTAICFFFALGRLPLAVAVTMAFTAPLWMIVMSHFLLNEPVTRRASAAVLLGFVGVLVMVFGGNSSGGTVEALDPAGVGAALCASFGYALAMVLLRKQSAHDAIGVLVFVPSTVGFLIVAPFGLATFEPLGNDAILQFALIGTLGTIGHLFMSWAFSNAPATRLAPFEYTTFMWAALFGFLFFDEIPGPALLVGAVLIIGGCAIVSAKPAQNAALVS